ncbi:hypothetical protein KSP40_PGU014507 [Platanthera guangdongensis]|uniref:Kinetochore protein NDC80 n=1 Tax=Platanthera guangdongensis TaxID=2320717 RepID=A0ABR2M1J3_9ASPA
MAMKRPRTGVAQRLMRTQSIAASGDFPRPTPSPSLPFYEYSSNIGTDGRRDSDASSFCSSLPSSAGSRSTYSIRSAPSDRASYLRAVNSYISSLSPPIFLKPPLPPAKDIIDALHRLFSRLDLDAPIHDLTRDLPSLLAALGCPVKLSKSALRAPSTPHAWPSVISVLHWLVQLARVSDHLVSSPSALHLSNNSLHQYISGSYSFFLSGDDCAVADLDAEYLDRAERDTASAVKNAEALEAEVAQLDEKHRDLASNPSPLEALEVERAALLEDVKKFQNVVDKFYGIIEEKKEKLAEREKELETRGTEKTRLDEEIEALRQRIHGQALSTRDVERMTRELQAVEREISDAERRRNETDEKTWLLNPEVEREFREIETSAEQCNQAIRK